MPFIGLIKVQVFFIKGRETLSNKLMRLKGEGGEKGERGLCKFQPMTLWGSHWNWSWVLQVVFELECHHHSWSHLSFSAGLNVYFHIHIQIFLFQEGHRKETHVALLLIILCSESVYLYLITLISLFINLKNDPNTRQKCQRQSQADFLTRD